MVLAVPGECGGRPRGVVVAVPGEKSWPSVGSSSCPLTAGVSGEQASFADGVAETVPDEDKGGLPGAVDAALEGLDHHRVPGVVEPVDICSSAGSWGR